MDFGALPPEVNSGRMYAGAGCGSLIAAASAWDGLAADLHSTAGSYGAVISGLTCAGWLGPASLSMAAAAAPYVAWLTTTAALCEQVATQARAAAAAYEAAFAMTVPPPVIATNRTLLMSLNATNILGQNTPAIAATEAHYGEMWAQDATAMYGYADASAAAATLSPFTPPQQTTNPAGRAGQAAAVAHVTGTSAAIHAHTILATGPHLISIVPHALETLASPASSTSSTSGLPAILQTLSGSSPLSALSLLTPYTAALATTNLGLNSAIMPKMAGTTGTTGTAVDSGALGSVSGSGVDPAASTLASAGITGQGGAGSAASASMGRANPIGMLSAPPSWATTAPAITRAAVALPSASPGAAPTVLTTSPENLLNGMVLARMAGQGTGGAAPQGRPTITITFTPHPPNSDNWD
jgi:PPE-repeat protein